MELTDEMVATAESARATSDDLLGSGSEKDSRGRLSLCLLYSDWTRDWITKGFTKSGEMFNSIAVIRLGL